MARDRKQRSKQRAARKAAKTPSAEHAGELVRSDVPGALDHASGDVDEFDAAIVRGAGGVPLPDETAFGKEAPGAAQPDAGGESDEASGAQVPAARRAAVPAEPRRPMGKRIVPFLRASWAELQRVQWPDRRHVSQATAVVLGFVVVAGVYLGAADWLAQKIVNFIL